MKRLFSWMLLVCLLAVAAPAARAEGADEITSSYDKQSYHVTVAKELWMSDGIDLRVTGLKENEDFTFSLRSPSKDETDWRGNFVATRWGYELVISRSNGKVSFQHERNIGSLSGFPAYPHAADMTCETEANGDLRIHISLETDNESLSGHETWPLDLITYYGRLRVVHGRMTLHHYPASVKMPEADSLTGGWRFVSASDGKRYDDMFISGDQVVFRRHDDLGGVYYAPRRITSAHRYWLHGDHFTWRVLEVGGQTVFSTDSGVNIVYQKTNETAEDYTLQYMSAGTPPCAALFGHDWHNYDDEFLTDLNSFVRYYEDVMVSDIGYKPTGGQRSRASDVRYEGRQIHHLDGEGTVTATYEWETSGLYHRVYLYQYQMKDGVRDSRRLIRVADMQKGRLLAPSPTPAPAATATPAPAPISVQAFKAVGKDPFSPSTITAYAGNHNRMSDGFSMAKDVTPSLNQIRYLKYSKSNAMMFVKNDLSVPARYRIYIYNSYSKEGLHVRLYGNNKKKAADLKIGAGHQEIQLVYTGAIQPGHRLYINLWEKDTDYSLGREMMICQDVFDAAAMKDEYSCAVADLENAAAPAVTPRPAAAAPSVTAAPETAAPAAAQPAAAAPSVTAAPEIAALPVIYAAPTATAKPAALPVIHAAPTATAKPAAPSVAAASAASILPTVSTGPAAIRPTAAAQASAWVPKGITAPPLQVAPVPKTPVPKTPVPATPTPQPLFFPVPGRSGCLQARVQTADATSWIVGRDPSAYTPDRMIDGREDTSFQFSTKKTRLGTMYLYFSFAGPVDLDEMWIKNGFWKFTDGHDQYTRNSRVKKMTIDFQYAGRTDFKDKKTVTLKDDKARRDWTVINLGGRKGVTRVRILIQDIYKGSRFKTDVCISEIMFVKKER